MPASTTGYGHDAHGVNIRNLRALTESPVRRLPGGYRTVQDWKRETQETITLAGHENFMSKSLRNASKKLQDHLKVKTEKDQAQVEKALKSKIQKTEHMKGLLEAALSNTRSEKLKLQANRNKLARRAEKMQQKLALSEARMKVRCDRPTREKVNDAVQLHLQRQEGLLHAYLTHLQRGIKAADVGVARLEKCYKKLQADFNDKKTALELDQLVLEGDLSNTNVAKNFMGGPQGLHPHHWTQSTEERIKEANKWIADSARLRHEVQNLMAEKDEAAKNCTTQLNVAMVEKLNETDDLKQSLLQKLEDTRKETEEAKQRKLALEKSLEEKRVPTQQAMQRLLIRKQRPRRERVDDEAHQALVTELKNLTAISSQLRDRITCAAREIKQLEEKARLLEENIRDKDSSWKVDEQCVLLDGRVTLSRPPSSVGSSMASGASRRSAGSNSSLRSEIMSRISKLEGELAKARTERISMEATVRHLRDETGSEIC